MTAAAVEGKQLKYGGVGPNAMETLCWGVMLVEGKH